MLQTFLAEPSSPEVRISYLEPSSLLISSKKVKKIPMGQISFNDSYLNESNFSVTHVFKTPRQEIESV
jgi:hypothetical protein